MVVPSKWDQMLAFLLLGGIRFVADDAESEALVVPVAVRGPKGPVEVVAPEVRATIIAAYKRHMDERAEDGFQKAERGFVEGLMERHRVSRVWIAGAVNRARKVRK